MRCIRCGLPGAGPEPWRKLCWDCFLSDHGARVIKPTKYVSNQLDDTRLRQLIQLCHPDKHNNSELSQVVTKWLLEMKG